MRFPRPEIPGAIAPSFVLPLMVLLIAAFAGMVTAVVGSAAGSRAINYIGFLSLLVIGGTVVATRRNPPQFVFLSLIVFLPVVDAIVPPGRYGLSVFDVVMIALTIVLVARTMRASAKTSEQFFPAKSLLIAWLLTIPSVVFSDFLRWSFQIFLENFAIYVFFLLALNELRRERMFERLVLLFAITSLVVTAGIYIEYFFNVHLGLRGTNLNLLSYGDGLQLRRVAGFFQDAQVAGAFLACLITFLLVLSVRGRFSDMTLRFLVWAAIVFGLIALVMTLSRAALLSCIFVSGITLFLLNRWSITLKSLIVMGVLLLVPLIAMMPSEALLDILPPAVAHRLSTTDESLNLRLMIWFDTWDMFADHPFAGIGLGTFQEYLMAKNPAIFNYYGIGTLEGTAYVPTQPESGYLKIFYESGLTGSIAVLLVIVDTLRRGFSIVVSKRSNADARTDVIAALAGLVTFAITFVTVFTLADERIAAIFAFLLAIIWHWSIHGAEVARRRSSSE